MHIIATDNVNNALALGLEHIVKYGVPEPSRNGPVLVAPGPVVTRYRKPWQRVLFGKLRNANPFFHLMESIWMIAGRNDLAFVQQFNSRFGQYSDDGKTIRGAYGHRWRKWFGYDQLYTIATELTTNPQSRRCVLAMWDPMETVPSTQGHAAIYAPEDASDYILGDLLATTVDKPCNTHIYFRVNAGVLDMTVCCRSNDILWGAYGANAVHMSFLQEVMAAWIGVGIGRYFQLSNNYHLYTDVLSPDDALRMAAETRFVNPYQESNITHLPLITDNTVQNWLQAAEHFVSNPEDYKNFNDRFFLETAYPMYKAWQSRHTSEGLGWAGKIEAVDWKLACIHWITMAQKRATERKSTNA